MTTHPYAPSHPAWTRALERLRPELDAIPAAELEPIRHHIPSAVVAVLGIAPGVLRHRGEVATEIGEAAARHLDRLVDAANACCCAHADYLATKHGIALDETFDDLARERRVLLAEAQSLVSQRRLSPSVLAELVGGTGYESLCFDLLQLVGTFRREWPSIESATPVTVADLDRAETIASVFATALGENARAGSSGTPLAELRARAYTYFVRTYDEVRRAIAFVRFDDEDADEIAPSLSAGRRRADDGDEATVDAPTNGAATAPGMPGGSPFVTS